MKVVVNKCYGGYSLSPLAVKRLAELNGKPCYFYEGGLYEPYKLVDVEKCRSLFWSASTSSNPEELNNYRKFGDSWHSMSSEEKDNHNKKHDDLFLSSRPDDRTDPLLIQVVEELGELADGSCAKLSIVEIPDGIEWEIDEYDGIETIHEKHRSW